MSSLNVERKLSQKEQFDALAKVAIIGDSSVGKTNILLRYVNSEYHLSHITTIGIDFKVKTVNINGYRIKLQIWDTAGQERFRNLTGTIYQGAQAIILAYSIQNRSSFDGISRWMEDVKNYSKKDTVVVLIGNKVDLETERVVTKAEGQAVAAKIGASFFQTSAKDNINVQELFKEIASKIRQNIGKKYAQDITKTKVTSEIETNKKQSISPNKKGMKLKPENGPKKKNCQC